MKIIMRGISYGFSLFRFILWVYLIAAPTTGKSAVLTRCPNPGYCFTTWQARSEWAANHNCQFDPASSSHDTLPATAQDCSKKNRADQKFLRSNEGELNLIGYMPIYYRDTTDSQGVKHKAGEVVGASGVTISTGVDLGQQSESGTRKILANYIAQYGNAYSVDENVLITKLHPYFGRKKENAVAALASTPLTITDPEADLLEKAFGLNTQSGVAKQFDNKNSLGMTFQQLPTQAQTAIVDFAYQYGLSETKGPIREKFWDLVYTGDWKGLSEWLLSNPDTYEGRRASEGALLKEALESGVLPNTGSPCGGVQNTSPGEPLPEFVPPIIFPGVGGPLPPA